MPNGWVQDILAEVTLPGALAQLVVSHYDPGATVVQCASDIMLRWRLWPNKINVRAWQGNGIPVASGQMMFIPADVETAAMAPNRQDTQSLSLRIKPDWLRDMAGLESSYVLSDPHMCVDFRDTNIEHAMRRLSSEVLAPGPCSRIILEACSLSIAGDLVRHFNQDVQESEDSRDILTERRLKRIEEFVTNYSDGCPTLAEIASDLGIGVGYLRQVFKKSTGKTLFKFIEEVRIARAQSLLATHATPLKLIAHQLGFCTPSAFSLAFRKATGLTPREYRLRCM